MVETQEEQKIHRDYCELRRVGHNNAYCSKCKSGLDFSSFKNHKKLCISCRGDD